MTNLIPLDCAPQLDVAVFACLCLAFYAVARIGELTLRSLTAFNANLHAKPSDVRSTVDRNGLSQTVLFVPRTKSAPDGEDLFWATQEGTSDPNAAWLAHLAINAPPRDGPLLAYRFKGSHRALTRSAFLARVNIALKAAGLANLQGHGLRIGGTLEYLLRSVPFDVVKSKGRWSSEAFLIYLRRHAQIMAPYMQAVPHVHDNFIRYAMPPVR